MDEAVTPLPRPLTTPPVTKIYFMVPSPRTSNENRGTGIISAWPLALSSPARMGCVAARAPSPAFQNRMRTGRPMGGGDYAWMWAAQAQV